MQYHLEEIITVAPNVDKNPVSVLIDICNEDIAHPLVDMVDILLVDMVPK